LATAETIVNHLHEKHPEIPPLDRSKYQSRLMVTLHPLNLADKLGIRFLRQPDFLVEKAGGWTTTEKVLPSGWMTIYSHTKNDPALPTLVMYGDSNIFPMRRFIAEHFRHSTFVNPWEAQDWAKSQFPPDFIATERPNIVLNMRAESGLLGAAANPPELRRIDASPH
jgi:hypothetical protein